MSGAPARHIAPYKWARELSFLDGAAIRDEMDNNLVPDTDNMDASLSDTDAEGNDLNSVVGNYPNPTLLCNPYVSYGPDSHHNNQ